MSMPHHLNDRTTTAPINAAAVTQTSTIGTTISRDRILLPHAKAYLCRGDEEKYSCDAVDNNGCTICGGCNDESKKICAKSNTCPNDTRVLVVRRVGSNEVLFHTLQQLS
mmetsp:Transcript_655/g.1070  ORF Transcript_655/g.1070 Transcript_655/m.1070 type:complete len:110 (+) Transcript_655:168-497(+)